MKWPEYRGGHISDRVQVKERSILEHTFFIDITWNATLRERLAGYTADADGTTFGLNHFTYNNPDFLEVMFNNLHSLQFQGIVVSCFWGGAITGMILFIHIGAYTV